MPHNAEAAAERRTECSRSASLREKRWLPRVDRGSTWRRVRSALFEAGAGGGLGLDMPDEVCSRLPSAMVDVGVISAKRLAGVLPGDATPLPSRTCLRIVITPRFEHVQDDVAAIAEMTRVLAPGGTFAATVPSWFPEKINWMLSDEYHAPKRVGGHVRIYTRTELRTKLLAAGLDLTHSHHAHALHSPYWWLRCLVGPQRDDHKWVARYKRFLEWDIIEQPRSTRIADRLLSPVLGKSIVLYARKPRVPADDRDHAGARGSLPWTFSLGGPEGARVLTADEIRVPVITSPRAAALRMIPWFRAGTAILEPRRVGDGPRRRWPPRRSGLGVRLVGGHATPRRQLAQLLPIGRHGRGTQARHQRLRLHRHRRVAPLPLHRRPELSRRPLADRRRALAGTRPPSPDRTSCGRRAHEGRGTTPCYWHMQHPPRAMRRAVVSRPLSSARGWQRRRADGVIVDLPGLSNPKTVGHDWYYPVLTARWWVRRQGRLATAGRLRDGRPRVRCVNDDHGCRVGDSRWRSRRAIATSRPRPTCCVGPAPRPSSSTPFQAPGPMDRQRVPRSNVPRGAPRHRARGVLAADAISGASPAADLFVPRSTLD